MVVAALVLGVAGGSYGLASAASGNSTATTPTDDDNGGPVSAAEYPASWGGQRSDETLLTGDTLAKVTAAALAKVSGGTIVRSRPTPTAMRSTRLT